MLAKPHHLNRLRRHGLTLLELIVVLSIIVMVTAFSAPALMRSFSTQKLDKGADQVRAEMGRARVKAMRTGEIFAFLYEPNGSTYKVAEFNEQIQEALQASRQREEARSSNMEFGDGLLPKEIRFAAADISNDIRSSTAVAEFSIDQKSMRMILFYPDGTSQDAMLTLQNENGDIVDIVVRGLTGLASVRKITDERRARQ